MTLLSCGNVNKDDIEVIGQAQNTKAGATVVSREDKKIYYVDGLDSWNDKIIGKIVKVSGKLLVEKKNPPRQEEEIKQQIVGIKRIILKPKWELVRHINRTSAILGDFKKSKELIR